MNELNFYNFRNESIQNQIRENLNANCLMLGQEERTYGDNLAWIYLQSLEVISLYYNTIISVLSWKCHVKYQMVSLENV